MLDNLVAHMAARGYAVLLPDPALSTGYGRQFIARAHRDWGARPFADIMAATEAAAARPCPSSQRPSRPCPSRPCRA